MPERVVKTKFFHYRQNNSGGYFHRNENVNVHVHIEAKDSDEANTIVEGFALYFDGRSDCRCCGNRWSKSWEEGTDEPETYGKSLGEEVSVEVAIEENEYCSVVHYYDGTKKYFKDG